MQFTKEETKNLPKIAHTSKVVSFYTCPRAPFYRETKGLFIPKIPSELENIPSVNMYTNVFYIPWFAGLISHIYKPATSSHVEPGLLVKTSLTWLLYDLRTFIHDSRISGIRPRDFLSSWFQSFVTSRLQTLTTSWFLTSASSWFLTSTSSWFLTSAIFVHTETNEQFEYTGLILQLFYV
jgi:hypothetical protein